MAYDYFNKPASLGYTYGAKRTLDDLEKDENFLEVSERFLQSVGENSDDVFEYLRDSDFNLASGMSRAMQSGKFNEQQKQDYAYLRREFDNADLGSLKQFAGLVKDAGIDIATDPTFIVAALAAPFTGGTSLASRTAIGTTGLKVAKNFVGPTPAFVGPARAVVGSLKEEGKKAVKKAATVGALEAGAWLGLDNHFRQTTELNTDIRKLYSLPELAGSTTLGVLTGGLVGGGIQKANLYYSKMNRLYSDDEYLKTKEGSLMDKVYKTLEIADKAKGSVIPIGSATSLLDTKAKFSPSTRLLGNLFREDFDRTFTSVTTKKVELGHGEMLDTLRGDYHRLFDEATAPLRKTGAFKESDELAVIRIMRGAKPEKYGAEVQQVAKDLEAFFNKIFDDAVDAGLIQEERKLANYFPRSWNRKVIEDNRTAFQQKLINEKIVKNEAEASNLVDGMLNKKNELFSSHSVLLTQARAFKNLDDNAFEEFLTTDFNTAINYYMNAANTIQHKKSFLLPKFTRKSNEAQFIERWLNPMDKELREARGQSRGLTSSDKKSIIKLYKSVTGQVDYFDSGLMQGVYDATKLANSVAYLPLATVSSLTEALIPLTKTGGSVTGPAKDALKGVAEGHKIFVQDIPMLLKKKHKMKDSDIQKEMQQVFMAMDESIAESTNRLTGEGLQNEALKKIGRGFFRLNMLTPWTKSVQLASFNIGKGLIRENLEALDKLAKEGVDIFDESKLMSQAISDKRAKVKSTSKIRDVQLLKSELYDLGIDVEDGIRWLNDGAKTTFGAERKDGVLTGEIKYADDFYKSVVQGAGRFVNEVIMPVGRDRARIPVFMTNPKVDILTQFLRYPAVFSNTVLKNYIRSAVVNPKVNGAKLGAFALITVNMALATNYWRSNKENKDRIVEEGINSKDITKAFARVGLLGPLDYGYRFKDSIEYTKNPAVSSISLGGPVMTDTLGLLLGRRGVTETVARKAPLIGTAGMIDTYFGEYFEENPYDELIKKAKEIDKEGNYLLGIKDRPKDRKYTRTYERSYTRNYAKGGLVEGKDDVPYTKENPADRVDPNTGKPYSDQMARLGLAEGGLTEAKVLSMVEDKAWFQRATQPGGELYKGKHTLLTMSSGDGQKEYLYPTIREVNGNLVDLGDKAFDVAMEKKDYIVFEGKDKEKKATEVSKKISDLIKPMRELNKKMTEDRLGLAEGGISEAVEQVKENLRDMFIQKQKLWEGDHGDTPMLSPDEREIDLPEEEKTYDIAYGHKIKKEEMESGLIHGIPFINKDTGKYIPLTEKQKTIIQQKDIKENIQVARKNGWDDKLAKRKLTFESLKEPYQLVLEDLAYNVGGTKAGKEWNNIFDDIKNDNIQGIVGNLRRKEAGVNTEAMDNRAAKAAYNAGLITNLQEAIDYGLPLATSTEIPSIQ